MRQIRACSTSEALQRALRSGLRRMGGIFHSITLMHGSVSDTRISGTGYTDTNESAGETGSPEYLKALKEHQEAWVERALTRIKNFQRHKTAMGIR